MVVLLVAVLLWLAMAATADAAKMRARNNIFTFGVARDNCTTVEPKLETTVSPR